MLLPTLLLLPPPLQVAMIGSGAWACAAMHIVAQNCLAYDVADEFVDEVRMWVYEEEFEGSKLTELINSRHENPKYLPGISLGANTVADPDLESTVRVKRHCVRLLLLYRCSRYRGLGQTQWQTQT
jgi:glycerol-3-phosphate dehydrogenase